MSGIIGLVLKEKTNEIFQKMCEMLSKLTHLGDDGTGIALIDEKGDIILERYPFKLDDFIKTATESFTGKNSNIGIGELRFATHGRPSIENTPPLTDCKREICVVMSGIISNYEELKEELVNREHILVSRNDAEIIAHLLEEKLKSTELVKALTEISNRLDGCFAAILMSSQHPNKLAVIAKGIPLFVGIGEHGNYIASELEAFHGLVNKYIKLEQGILILDHHGFDVYNLRGEVEKLTIKDMPKELDYKVPGGFNYYMEREIFEIPLATRKALLVHQKYYLDLVARMLLRAEKIYIIGAGSSYHVGLVGSYLLRELCDITAIVIDAVEFLYYALRDISPGTVVVTISQSGKSTDVIRAVSKAKMYGASIIGILNKLGSPLMYASNLYLPIGVGPERAVPATKSFIGQLITMIKIAIRIAEIKNLEHSKELDSLKKSLNEIPDITKKVIRENFKRIEKIAKDICQNESIFITSRGINYPIALEGALKIKEVSYIHAEGVEAGMLRHGPKAIIKEGFPVISIMPQDREAKNDMYRLINELDMLGAKNIIITNEKDTKAEKLARFAIRVPEVNNILTPIINIIPLQILAFYLGKCRGTNIDKPRGLSKYVIIQQM